MKERSMKLGLRPNLTQFILLAVNNAFVGSMVGIERTVVPVLGKQSFHLNSLSILLAFIVSFGIVKGPLNLVAGRLADRWGRKPILLLGWIFALPVPLMTIFAPSWGWIIAANLLLGANQGFAWSMTVTSKVDLVGPARRGTALGINEFSGYIGVAIISGLSGYLASVYGPRPIPFIVAEVIGVIGLLMAWVLIRETLPYTRLEMSTGNPEKTQTRIGLGQVIAIVSFKNRTLLASSQAGLVNKLSDTAVWGLVPVLMAQSRYSVSQIGLVSSIYVATWGVLQLFSGTWSDKVGRKTPIVLGQLLNAVGVGFILLTHSFAMWVTSALLMGIGTALVYPVLLSAVGDEAHPTWRGSALGVYRMWRDGGYAIGGIVIGFGVDWFGTERMVGVLAAIVLVSGLFVLFVMKETLRKQVGVNAPLETDEEPS